MDLTISTIKSIASRNVWSSDWSAPFCKAIFFHKRGYYNHTHPEWRSNLGKIMKELNISRKHPKYKIPARIILIKFGERGFHLPMARKAIYLSIQGTNIVLGSDNNPIAVLGEMDKVKQTPSWANDFWNRKQIWNKELIEDEWTTVGNLQTSCVFPEKDNMVLVVEYAE